MEYKSERRKKLSNGRHASLAIATVEKVLGTKLPKGAVVHHLDGNPFNDNKSNLLVCPDQAYHMMIHRRQRAYDDCGDANAQRCGYCSQHGYGMKERKDGTAYHAACASAYNKSKRLSGDIDAIRKLGREKSAARRASWTPDELALKREKDRQYYYRKKAA